MENVRSQSSAAVSRLSLLGYDTFTPIENGVDKDAPTCEHMKVDYGVLVSQCDAIYLCEGWEYSHGCMNELHVASDCRLMILTHDMDDVRLLELRQRMEN